MKQQPNSGHTHSSDHDAFDQIGIIEPTCEPVSAAIDGGHDANEQQDSDDLQGALDHDFYHAATRPQPIVSAAQAGFALAAQIKHTRSLPPGEVPETQFNVWNALVRMHEAPATTSTDALALIATAERLLFSIDINQIVEQDRQMFHAARSLVGRSALALQIACCIHKDTFTGDGETAN